MCPCPAPSGTPVDPPGGDLRPWFGKRPERTVKRQGRAKVQAMGLRRWTSISGSATTPGPRRPRRSGRADGGEHALVVPPPAYVAFVRASGLGLFLAQLRRDPDGVTVDELDAAFLAAPVPTALAADLVDRARSTLPARDDVDEVELLRAVRLAWAAIWHPIAAGGSAPPLPSATSPWVTVAVPASLRAQVRTTR